MPNRISKISSSLKQLGQAQVTELDLIDLMNKDLRDLEISSSLRRLGDTQVLKWDFREVLPAVSKLAQQEVDVAGLIKRAANYRIMEWDFRRAGPDEPKPATPKQARPAETGLCPEEMQALMLRLKNFLQFVVVKLIDEPSHAHIKVQEIGPNVLRFKLVLVNRDVAMLVGRKGHTAAAIRSILKATAGMNGVQALLQIHSHEEEATLGGGARREADEQVT